MTYCGIWHVPGDLILRFGRDPAGLDAVTGSSIEAHLIACEPCRTILNRHVDEVWRTASWDRIADVIDRPRRTMLERALDRTAIASGPARLIASTPGFRLAVVAAVAAIATLAVLITRQADSIGAFLAIAPLVPVAAIWLGFAPAADPGGEAGAATPTHGVRLTLLRTAAALVVSLALLVAGSLTLPDVASTAFLWVLPGLALAFGCLASGTWFPIERCAISVSAVWVVSVAVVRRLADADAALATTALFRAPGQLTAVVVAGIACGLFMRRVDRYSSLEVRA